MLTKNERKVIRLLMASFSRLSINDVARECYLAPNGANKILKKMEKQGVLIFEDVGRIKAYQINFGNPLAHNYLEIALADERSNEPKIKVRAKDLENMKQVCQAAILFGSYVTEKKSPSDIDILFVLDKEKFGLYKKHLEAAKEIIPFKIHDILQTSQDLSANLKKSGSIIAGIIRTGVVLWGHENIAGIIEHAKTK